MYIYICSDIYIYIYIYRAMVSNLLNKGQNKTKPFGTTVHFVCLFRSFYHQFQSVLKRTKNDKMQNPHPPSLFLSNLCLCVTHSSVEQKNISTITLENMHYWWDFTYYISVLKIICFAKFFFNVILLICNSYVMSGTIEKKKRKKK